MTPRRRSRRRPGRLIAPLRWGFGALVRLRLVRTFLFIVLCVIAWGALNYGHLRELALASEQAQRLAAEVEIAERQLAQMQRLRAALSGVDNHEAVERLAREQSRLTYPGEVLVYIERPAVDLED